MTEIPLLKIFGTVGRAGIRPIVNMGSSTTVRFPSAAPDTVVGTAGNKHHLEMGATFAYKPINTVLQDLLQVNTLQMCHTRLAVSIMDTYSIF